MRRDHAAVAAVSELLDVDVPRRYDPDTRDEPGRPVHVPDPHVREDDLEPWPVLVGLDVDLIGQVEAPLGLDRVAEHGQDVPVLPEKGQLGVGLELLDLFFAHRGAHYGSGETPSTVTDLSGSTSRSSDSIATRFAISCTPLNEIRWIGLGPCSSNASQCFRVPYPRFVSKPYTGNRR